jgi:hypothetical protein
MYLFRAVPEGVSPPETAGERTEKMQALRQAIQETRKLEPVRIEHRKILEPV